MPTIIRLGVDGTLIDCGIFKPNWVTGGSTATATGHLITTIGISKGSLSFRDPHRTARDSHERPEGTILGPVHVIGRTNLAQAAILGTGQTDFLGVV